MHLTPTERDRLLVFSAAELARRRKANGVLLNVPESIALICDTVIEAARAGHRHAQALEAGRSALRPADVLPEVPHIVRSVSVEAVFTDGSRLVVVPLPFGPLPAAGKDEAVMPGLQPWPDDEASTAARSGEECEAAQGNSHEAAHHGGLTISVVNTAAVAVSVTSHFHFFEANPRLLFDREVAYGMHLDIPSGTHVRFEPQAPREVPLVPIRGRRVVVGFTGLVDGPLDAPGARAAALDRARACGFLDTGGASADAEGAVASALDLVRSRGAGQDPVTDPAGTA